MQNVALVLWGLAMGAIVLFVFFTSLAGVSPLEVAGVTAVIGVLALLWAVRSARIDFELRSRGGDPQLRSVRNRLRERRGF